MSEDCGPKIGRQHTTRTSQVSCDAIYLFLVGSVDYERTCGHQTVDVRNARWYLNSRHSFKLNIEMPEFQRERSKFVMEDQKSIAVYRNKTYSSRDSHVLTHRSTNLPFNCLCMAERTGCPVFS